MLREHIENEVNPEERYLPWRSGTVLLDEYRIDRLLGEGGMGKVYLVTSLSTGYRYAVKRCKLDAEADRRNFLTELQTWIDLPDHQHLVACRFFRTINGDIVIFSDYIEGGSLSDLIRKKSLVSVESILDAAIQFAVGLHVIHEHGFVHQDVKPANVLVTKQGDIKVADFGLARARIFAMSSSSSEFQRQDTALVPGSGYMTRTYASPEQIAGHPLSRKSDIWSWGVSLLEMFTGEVTWQSGALACEVLEAFVENGFADTGLPSMPQSCVDLLRKCFVKKPSERIPTLLHVVDILKTIYAEVVGRGYKRFTSSNQDPNVNRQEVFYNDDSVPWIVPQEWLVMAMQMNGQNPLNAARFMTSTAPSLRSKALSDMTGYDEAMKIYEHKLRSDDPMLCCQYACLCVDKASVHEHLGDFAGAIALYDNALCKLEGVRIADKYKITALFAAASGKAQLLIKQAKGDDAFPILQDIVKTCDRLPCGIDKSYRARSLISSLLDMAQIERERDRPRATLPLYSRIMGEMVNMPDANKPILQIRCLIGRHQAYKDLEDIVSAERDLQSAIGIYAENESVLDQATGVVLAINRASLLAEKISYDGALCVLNEAFNALKNANECIIFAAYGEFSAALLYEQARILVAQGRYEAGIAHYERSVKEYEILVFENGRLELAGNLTKSLSAKAQAFHHTGDMNAAISCYDKAISVLNNLAEKHEDWRLKINLASLIMSKANAVAEAGNRSASFSLYDQAAKLQKELRNRMPIYLWVDRMATTYTNKSEYLLADGMGEDAKMLCEKAIMLLEQYKQEMRVFDYAFRYAWVNAHQAEIIWRAGDINAARQQIDEALVTLRKSHIESPSPQLRWALNDAEAVARRMAV